eukprot:GHVT01046012.1.p1 GENE.GHVT01046012.1~~GHVT01046012.1.p1  ORF type:complete len:210 (+),score=49.29 GHVT01046012.1:288-917(+)
MSGLAAVQGVTLTPWREFMCKGWQRFYSRVAIRRLNWRKSRDQLADLAAFLSRAVGAPYSLNLRALASSTGQDDPKDKYFCSELVASAWKAIGVLSPLELTHRIWPGDFGDEGQLQFRLLGGASLDREILIDFDLDASRTPPPPGPPKDEAPAVALPDTHAAGTAALSTTNANASTAAPATTTTFGKTNATETGSTANISTANTSTANT